MKKFAGKLFLIPNTLGDTNTDLVIPHEIGKVIHHIAEFIVEDEKSARKLLKKLSIKTSQQDLKFQFLNEHTPKDEIWKLLTPLINGDDVGLISEAGCPAVADPGAELVLHCHKNNIRVIPLVGPSSILLALMASGLNGQNFTFHGYLPKSKEGRRKKIKLLERDSIQKNQTQIFIETPYRNNHLLDDLCDTCNPATLLTVAADLTLPSEFVCTKNISEWKQHKPDINKKPAIFLLLAQ